MNAIYPGTFEPFHQGHLNIIIKASKLFTKVFIVVTNNINKTIKTPTTDRKKQIIGKIKNIPNVEVIINESNLTIDIAHQTNSHYIIRGLRNMSDFEYELQIYDGNKTLDQEIETIYFISDIEKRKISSTVLKEIEHYKK